MVNTELQCVNGCTDWEWIYSFPSAKSDYDRYAQWLCLFRIKNPKNETLFACERHFSPQMRVNKCFLSANALPDRNFETQLVDSEAAASQQFYSQCVRVSQRSLLSEENQSLVVPNKKPKLNDAVAHDENNETDMLSSNLEAFNEQQKPAEVVATAAEPHKQMNAKTNKTPATKLPTKANSREFLRALLEKPSAPLEATLNRTTPSNKLAAAESTATAANKDIAQLKHFDAPVSVVPSTTAMQIVQRLKDISVKPSTVTNKTASMAKLLNAACEVEEIAEAPPEMTAEAIVDANFRADLLVFCVWSCDICEKEYGSSNLYILHMECKHQIYLREELTAYLKTITHKLFYPKTSFNRPISYPMHIFGCVLCDKAQLESTAALQQHIADEHALLYKLLNMHKVLAPQSSEHTRLQTLRSKLNRLYKYAVNQILSPKAPAFKNSWYLCLECDVSQYSLLQLAQHAHAQHPAKCSQIVKGSIYIEVPTVHSWQQPTLATPAAAENWHNQLQFLKSALQLASVADKNWLECYIEPIMQRFGVEPSALPDTALAEQITKELFAIFSSNSISLFEPAAELPDVDEAQDCIVIEDSMKEEIIVIED